MERARHYTQQLQKEKAKTVPTFLVEMLFSSVGLLLICLLTLRAAAVTAPFNSSGTGSELGLEIGNNAPNTKVSKPWPENLPSYFYSTRYPYPHFKVRLELAHYGAQLPDNRDWWSFFEHAYHSLEGEIAVDFPQSSIVDKEIEASGGEDRILWTFTPGRIPIKSEIVQEFIFVMWDMYSERDLRETICTIQLEERDAAQFILRRGDGP